MSQNGHSQHFHKIDRSQYVGEEGSACILKVSKISCSLVLEILSRNPGTMSHALTLRRECGVNLMDHQRLQLSSPIPGISMSDPLYSREHGLEKRFIKKPWEVT
jgi:hypothetical protein